MVTNTEINDSVANDDYFDASYFNDIYNSMIARYQSYTGTGFDVSQVTTGTDTQNHDIAIAANSVKEYVEVFILVECVCDMYQTGAGVSATGKIELKVGTDTDDDAALTTTTLLTGAAGFANATGAADVTTLVPVRCFYIPSAGEITSGFNLRITLTATSVNGTATGTNKGVFIKNR